MLKLIINADDFGLSKSITDGIVYAIKNGYVTSTTLMANMEYTEYAIDKAIKNNIDCIGLHINMTLGKPIIPNKHLTDENGIFFKRDIQISNDNLTYQDAYSEIKAQIARINELSNNRIKIDHLDTHHFITMNDTIKKAVQDISKELNIPVRNENNINTKCPDVFYEKFSLYDVDINSIKKILDKYKDKDITLELLTHPGYIDEYTKKITSKIDREVELDILKSAKDRGMFSDIKLISFKNI